MGRPPARRSPRLTRRRTRPGLRRLPGHIEVAAPMVGTLLIAPPQPGCARSLSTSARRVKAGQPLCLIEVMKLFTTINSEASGRVAQIGAENGELVEYGRTLFAIEPD